MALTTGAEFAEKATVVLVWKQCTARTIVVTTAQARARGVNSRRVDTTDAILRNTVYQL